MTYLDTPQTEAGDPTYMSNAFDLENFSEENSISSPSKHTDDLLSQIRKGRGMILKTSHERTPLANRPNVPAASRGDFTPLLKSAVKNSVLRKSKLGGPPTPAALKDGYEDPNSVALPTLEASGHYEDTRSSAEGPEDGSPVPQFVSSSVASTPLPELSRRNASGVLNSQSNVMTLREQESIISKIEKENFGLKLKIHFLEESLRLAGPGFNEAALKENTTLKVDRVTLLKELARAKKTLSQAEHDVENYSHHLQVVQEQMKRKHLDDDLRQELNLARREIASKQKEVDELNRKLESAEDRGEEQLRMKETLGERDDEILQLKVQAREDAEELDRLQEELDTERDKIEALQDGENEAEHRSQDELQEIRQSLEILKKDLQVAEDETKEANQDAQRATEMKERLENELNELRDEMSNKSMNTKGWSRQLEEKAKRFQDDLDALRKTHEALNERFDEKSKELKRVQNMMSDNVQDAKLREMRLQDEIELLRHQNQAAISKCEHLEAQIQQARQELLSKSEAKDLLHSRHDALTVESQTLQKDLAKALRQREELETELENEKQHALENERQLRIEANNKIDKLSDEIASLQRSLDAQETQNAAHQDHWESQRRALESQKEKLQEQAAGLQRTVDKLQETEGTLSNRDMKLREAHESEKERFRSEEAVLGRQIHELNNDVIEKQRVIDEVRFELSEIKDQLRVSLRDQADLEEKVEVLEEELQNGLDEADQADEEIEATKKEADLLRQELQVVNDDILRLQRKHADTDARTTSEQQLVAQLDDLESRLTRVQKEKQSLQDKLASVNIELRNVQVNSAEMEAERDEFKNQVRQMQDQVDDTFRVDQEKLNLRKVKTGLETDVRRLREERQLLIEKRETAERELVEEIGKSGSEAGLLKDEIAELQRKLASVSGGRDRELSALKKDYQRLEKHAAEVEAQVARGMDDSDDKMENSNAMKDLTFARSKETEYLQREISHKGTIRDLKQEIARLERQLHELQISQLTSKSPQSSIGGSARKDEILDIRRQLAEVHQQMKDLRSKSKEKERELQQKFLELRDQAQSDRDSHEQERDQLEQELSTCRQQYAEESSKATAAENATTRLRTRIQNLEKDIQAHRLNTAGDLTMADERKDLHEMLKDAKLTAETLQVGIVSRDTLLAASTAREKELDIHLARLREQRILELNRASALTKELQYLQNRYERALDDFARQQQKWEEERKKITSGVRFANMSISSLHGSDNIEQSKPVEEALQEQERRHLAEMRGLSKQIIWLRARFNRERSFRETLAHGKQYLLAEIASHEASTKKNLAILSRMGIKQRSPYPPPPLCPHATRSERLQHRLDSIQDPARKKPCFKAVALMVIAKVRMQRMAEKWAEEKKVKAALLKGLENLRKKRKEREALEGEGEEGKGRSDGVGKERGK